LQDDSIKEHALHEIFFKYMEANVWKHAIEQNQNQSKEYSQSYFMKIIHIN